MLAFSALAKIVNTDRKLDRLIVLLTLAISLPFSAVVAFIPGHLDGSNFLYIGERWAAGTIPYLELFDNKPPGIFALIALAAHTRHTLWALCVIEFLFVIACIGTIRRILQRCGAPEGTVFFGTLATALMVNSIAYNPGNNPETYMLWPMSASMLAFFIAIESRKLRFVFLAGFCSGLACLFKPFGLSALIAQIVFTLFQGWTNRRAILSSIAANLAGATVGWIPVLGYFSLHGALRELLDASFFYNVHYGVAAQQNLFSRLTMLAERLLPVSTILACLAFGLARSLKNKSKTLYSRDSLWTLTLLWFTGGLLLVLAAGRGYPHYFMSLTPPLGLAAGLFFWSFEEHEMTTRLRVACGALILAPILMTYIPGLIVVARDLRSVMGKHQQMLPVDEAAMELQRIAPRSSTLLVWGYEPSLFYATHLRNASKYPTTQYIYDSPRSYAEVGSVVLNGMRTSPPDFVVITPWDLRMTWPHQSDPVRDEFMAIVQKSYVEVWQKDSYLIYRHHLKD